MSIAKLLAVGDISVQTRYDKHPLRIFTEFPLLSLEETVKGADCLVLLVDHKEFKGINLDALLKKMRDSLILDTMN